MIRLQINDQEVSVPEEFAQASLLDVLREALNLRGTRYGCGVGMCGACTVHVDAQARRACLLRADELTGRSITTIEGLGTLDEPHVVQAAWIEERVPQCGFCQSGQIMSAAALLARNPAPARAEIDEAMSGNLCRCGTYPRIVRAIQKVGR